jgi:hypothetical protein
MGSFGILILVATPILEPLSQILMLEAGGVSYDGDS